MNKRSKRFRPSDVLSILAVLSFMAGGYAVYNAVQTAEHKSWTVVLDKPVDAYTELTADDVDVEQRNTESLPKDAIILNSKVDIKALWNKTKLVNQVTVRELRDQEVLSLDDVTNLTAALPALLVKSGHSNDLAVSIPVNPNNGMSITRVNNGDSLYLSIEDMNSDKTNPNAAKQIETVDTNALVIAKDEAQGNGNQDSGYVYVPLTPAEFKLIQQNGGPSHVMVGLTSEATNKLEGSK